MFHRKHTLAFFCISFAILGDNHQSFYINQSLSLLVQSLFWSHMYSGITHHCDITALYHEGICDAVSKVQSIWSFIQLQHSPGMGFSTLDVIKALILKLFLEEGDCLHNYVMLNRSISKGEEIFQKPKITQCFHCWKYQESRHTPLSFLLITL